MALRAEKLFDVAGKVAVITGGNRGIGYMVAEGFVQNNATVYILNRKKEQGEIAARTLTEIGPGRAFAIQADLTSDEACSHAVAEIASRESEVHILVNNAGANWAEPLETFPEKAWHKLMAVNVVAPFNLTRAMLPLLEASTKSGSRASVINMGSVLGDSVPHLEIYAYGPSKAALYNLTKSLANRLAKRSINVNTITAGWFVTDMTKDVSNDELLSKIPTGRFAEKSDIVSTCLYLSSKAGQYVTGTALTIDGGYLNATLVQPQSKL